MSNGATPHVLRYLKHEPCAQENVPHVSVQRQELVPEATANLIDFKNSPERHNSKFLAKMVTPGWLIWKSGTPTASALWVISVSQESVVGWAIDPKRPVNGVKMFSLSSTAGRTWKQLAITEHKGWYVQEVVAYPPGRKHLALQDDATPYSIGLIAKDTHVSLKEHAARCAFRGFTVEHMKKFARFEKVPHNGPLPTTEYGLTKLLVRWALPKASLEDVEQIVRSRWDAREFPFETVITADDVEDAMEEAGDDGDRTDIAKAMEAAVVATGNRKPPHNPAGNKKGSGRGDKKGVGANTCLSPMGCSRQ